MKLSLILISIIMVLSCYGYLATKKLKDVRNEYSACVTQHDKLEIVLEMERAVNDLSSDDVDKWLLDNGLLEQ